MRQVIIQRFFYLDRVIFLAQHCKYIVEGYTEDGRKFRPSDWIDRVASMMATYGKTQRLVYSDLMHPELYNGEKCLIVDTELEVKNPGMFEYVMHFAKSNNLRTTKVCELIEKDLGA